MQEQLKKIFSQFNQSATVEMIDSELFKIKIPDLYSMPIAICAKKMTFGGRENLKDEQRIQIKAYSNNYCYNRLINNEKSVLLGIYETNNDTIICAWKLKNSNAQNTISKQIKSGTITKALNEGFAQQNKGSGEYACAFRKELLFFYLNNSDWIHDGRINELNNHDNNLEVIYDDSVIYDNRVNGGSNILLYGVPGCGKSHTIKTDFCNSPQHMERVVFHPDYTYSDFIGQILPKVLDDRIIYTFTPGPFTKILSKAYKNPGSKYYLIIEEINRGNAPAIFGEVFQLLDRDSNGDSEYSISNSDMAKIVYGDKDKLVSLPSNLSILATMNSSDQNVFTLDTAFQRRWHMRMIENNINSAYHSNTNILDTNITWGQFVKTINKQLIDNNIGISSSEDKRLGAYFINSHDLEFSTIEGSNTPESNHFAEKVFKYLWDDAFKFSRYSLFASQFTTLEDIIKTFNTETGQNRFLILNSEILSKMSEI